MEKNNSFPPQIQGEKNMEMNDDSLDAVDRLQREEKSTLPRKAGLIMKLICELQEFKGLSEDDPSEFTSRDLVVLEGTLHLLFSLRVIDGKARIATIKAIRNVSGLGLKESKEFADRVFCLY
jgi:hypothetical protein